MKKTLIVLALVVFFSAVTAYARVGSIDDECMAYGFDFGIAKWEFEGGSFVLSDFIAGYNTSVVGSEYQANWSSYTWIDGVLSKEGLITHVFSGGTNGQVESTMINVTHNNNNTNELMHGISHITLCGETPACTSFSYTNWGPCIDGVQTRSVTDSSPENCEGGNPITQQTCYMPPPPNGVPEFPTIMIGVAILGGTLGLAYLRRE